MPENSIFALDSEIFLYCCSIDDGYTCDTSSKVKTSWEHKQVSKMDNMKRAFPPITLMWMLVFREAKSFDRFFKNSVFLYNLLEMKNFLVFTIQFRKFAECFRHRRWQL